MSHEADANEDPPIRSITTVDLLQEYASILTELRRRGVVRTSNAPLGDYAEWLALRVYGGQLAANSAKSYDIVADAGRIQVKARTWAPGDAASSAFSVFRTFDFDAAVLIVVDRDTYALLWVREVSPDEVRANSRWSEHVRGWLLPVKKAAQLGRDVSEEFRELDR